MRSRTGPLILRSDVVAPDAIEYEYEYEDEDEDEDEDEKEYE